MSDQQQAWERMEGEPERWYRRFERYRLMEPVRSIAAVYQEEHADSEEVPLIDVKRRMKVPGEWYKLAEQWKWEERAVAWDKHETEKLEKQIAAERAKVLTSGYALMHKRIERLNALVEKLLEMTDDEDKVWVPDVKSVGTGPTAERVDLVQFNAPLFHEIRAYLADIAAEMGERSKKSEVSLTVLPKVYQGTDPDEDGIDP